jgi:HK97 family phage major capsid protein
MVYAIEEKDITSESKLKFYGNRTILGMIKKLKDADGRPITEYVSTDNGQVATVLGYEFVTTPVMPSIAGSAANTKFLVFGDLSAFIIGDRQTITMDYGYRDGDWEADIQSLKVRERIDGELVFPSALSVLKTA